MKSGMLLPDEQQHTEHNDQSNNAQYRLNDWVHLNSYVVESLVCQHLHSVP